MTDFLVRSIPLPLPRPVMEEIVPGGVNPGIKLDIPLPDMATVDLSYPRVGTEWLLIPYRKGIEAMEGSYDYIANNWTDFFTWLLVASLSAAAGILFAELILWFHKRYVRNIRR